MRQKETKHREVIQAVISEQQQKGYDMLQVKNQFKNNDTSKTTSPWSTHSQYLSQHQLRSSPITGIRVLEQYDKNASSVGNIIKLYKAKPLRELFRTPLGDQTNIKVPGGLKMVEYLNAAEHANENEVQKMMQRTSAQLKAQILQDAYSNWRYNLQFQSQEIPGQGVGSTWNGPGSYKFNEKGGVWRCRTKQRNERALQLLLDNKSRQASAGANSAYYGKRYTRPSRAFSYQMQEQRLNDLQQGNIPQPSNFSHQNTQRYLSINKLLNKKLDDIETVASKNEEIANIISKRSEAGVRELLQDQTPVKHHGSPVWGLRPQLFQDVNEDIKTYELNDLDDEEEYPFEVQSRLESAPIAQKRFQVEDWGGGYGYESRGLSMQRCRSCKERPNTQKIDYRSVSNYNYMPDLTKQPPVLPHDFLIKRASALKNSSRNGNNKSEFNQFENNDCCFMNKREETGHYVQSDWNRFVARLKSIRHLRADRDAQLQRNNLHALFK